jgi:hypothetical protein
LLPSGEPGIQTFSSPSWTAAASTPRPINSFSAALSPRFCRWQRLARYLAHLGPNNRQAAKQVCTAGLGQGEDRPVDDCVDDRQLLIDDLLPAVSELNQHLAAIGGVRATLDQTAAFEGVDQRGHAGAGDDQPLGDEMAGECLTGAVQDREGLDALADRSCASRTGRSISARTISWVCARFTATSLADRLAPGNSDSKSAGTRMVEMSGITGV